jgi:hypothetical protein
MKQKKDKNKISKITQIFIDIDNESLVSLPCSKNNLSSLRTYIHIPRARLTYIYIPRARLVCSRESYLGSDPRRRILSVWEGFNQTDP